MYIKYKCISQVDQMWKTNTFCVTYAFDPEMGSNIFHQSYEYILISISDEYLPVYLTNEWDVLRCLWDSVGYTQTQDKESQEDSETHGHLLTATDRQPKT